MFKLSGCAVAYVWHASLRGIDAARALLDAGYELRNQIIWIKANFAMSRGDYLWQHEPCWYAVKKGQRSSWNGDRTQSTFWQIAAAGGFGRSNKPEDAPTGHGTQKPVECMGRPIRNHTCKTILDPFCGSGSTLVAAHQLERIGYGIELDPGYVAVTLERMTTLGLKPELVK